MLNLKLCLFLASFLLSSAFAEDYYELLGIAKNADNREIRKAFKKLAVKLHPDKNKDDPSAHSTFIRLTKAYEVLKDEESRKKYDLYGEEGIKSSQSQNYHSWSYYQDNFGIYDDDPEIITLNKADFEQSVLNSNSLWFINFYSPMCSHCHLLAPAWRRLARELEGVVRIGAVNCEDDWALCRQENVRSYPSLIMYPTRERYNGDRNEEEMKSFVLKRRQVEVLNIGSETWDTFRQKEEIYRDMSWLLFMCHDDSCPDSETRIKVAAMLEGLVAVGVVDCATDGSLCDRLSGDSNVVFWEHQKYSSDGIVHKIIGSDAKDIARETLAFLPDAIALNGEDFEDMQMQLRIGSTSPWLVYFYIGDSTYQDLEIKKLPALLPSIRIGKVHCGRESKLCQQMHINRYPVFAVFKPGGGYEIHHGRETAHDVANFALESSSATNLRILTPSDFMDMVNHPESSGGAWFVDFYAPWCPPCMRLLPEFRKASRHFDSAVNFGTIDCTVHINLCRQYNIRSYPTTILYNRSNIHQFHGGHTADDLVEFVQDMLNPAVTKLTDENFYKTVGKKSKENMWLVDYFAPWCGPCQQLAPQWRKLAKMIDSLPNVHVAEVNCEEYGELCMEQGVRSYPTIRLYPFGGEGLSTFAIYSSFQRDARTLRQWLYNFIPSPVENLTPETFESKVVGSKDTWLVDFYAPWCGHCVAFAPEFQQVAQKLEGRAKSGKVDCDANRALCQRAGVSAYPTVMLYHNTRSYRGEEIESQSGDYIISYVERVMKKSHHSSHDEF
ncbi:dnaJ homolog subfamily C member 10 [Anabrus simplex]|uniref:dnaJ homolog subfamily C member 10 n=1 Tax=Anabrus simplex TaxID=316456 RepID=UPI0035A320B8